MRWFIFLFMCLCLQACSFAPKYQRPAMRVPAHYKETEVTSNVKLTRHWWEMYHDPVLNELEAQIIPANQNLKAAIARFDQACASLDVEKAAYYPTVLGVFNTYRQQTSANSANQPTMPLYNDNLLALNVHYEVDAWGRIRNSVAAAKSALSASAADVAVINLSLQTDLAKTYFSLRSSDASLRVLNKTVTAYKKALDLTRARYKGGAVSIVDVEQAETQFENARTSAADMRLRRAQFEHAIAVLIGKPPSDFHLAPKTVKPTWTQLAPSLPSTLLERRPDIVEAEFLVKEANARIGVARAAFFPSINLSLAGGFESDMLHNLISRPSLIWALGPTTGSALLNNGSMPFITQTVFDGGLLSALARQADAKYIETVANYRQTVLQAFQDVEDQLVALRELDREKRTQTAATRAAERALKQALFRYTGGLTNYLDVIIAQNFALQAELATIDIYNRRQLASVQLIKALGGGAI